MNDQAWTSIKIQDLEKALELIPLEPETEALKQRLTSALTHRHAPMPLSQGFHFKTFRITEKLTSPLQRDTGKTSLDKRCWRSSTKPRPELAKIATPTANADMMVFQTSKTYLATHENENTLARKFQPHLLPV